MGAFLGNHRQSNKEIFLVNMQLTISKSSQVLIMMVWHNSFSFFLRFSTAVDFTANIWSIGNCLITRKIHFQSHFENIKVKVLSGSNLGLDFWRCCPLTNVLEQMCTNRVVPHSRAVRFPIHWVSVEKETLA